MESGNKAAFLIGASIVFVAGHCCFLVEGQLVFLYFGGCWGLWVSLVEVFDELGGKEISSGDPLVV